MKYKVVWIEDAENELTVIWLASRQRERVTEAAREIERLLETEPNEVGESRAGNRRIVFARPLGVTYEVDELRRVVLVFHLWQFGRRRGFGQS
jgi:mRNA-degrading endonuclease RelE of RelBE toxin-antitoxin system